MYVQPQPTDRDALQRAWTGSVVASAVAAKSVQTALDNPQLAAVLSGAVIKQQFDAVQAAFQPAVTRELDLLLQDGGLDYLDKANTATEAGRLAAQVIREQGQVVPA